MQERITGELNVAKVTVFALAAMLAMLLCSSVVAGSAYASAWSDSVIAQIDALPEASVMTMEQAKQASKLANEVAARMKIADGKITYSDDADKIGLAHMKKLMAAVERLDVLDGQIVSNAKAAKVKGVKVKAKKGKAVVSWKKLLDDSTLSSDVDVVTGYDVLMSTKKNKGFKVVDTTFDVSKTKTTVWGLEKGKRYYFKVRALVFDPDADEDKDAYSKASKVVRSKAIK